MIKYLTFGVSIAFISWIVGMIFNSILMKTNYYEKLSNLNFIRSKTLNKILGIEYFKWIVKNTFFKFFNQKLGSNISNSLFENIDSISASAIQSEIEDTITNYEPRVDLIGVDVEPNYENNEFNVTVKYYIIGIEALPQQLSFALQPTR